MKKIAMIIGTLVLVATIAYPVFGHGPGWGRGHHRMGGGYGSGDCWRGSEGSGRLTEDQANKLDELNRKFYEGTESLRDEIWSKSEELKYVLNSSDPDVVKARALQKDISDLRAMMGEKRLDHELEMRKILPEGNMGRGYRKGYGKGRGRGDWGQKRGYGPGRCWR